MKWACVIVLALANCSLAAEPARIIVAADGSGDFKTIQEALDAVRVQMPPTVIHIRPGVYKEVVRVPNNKPFITLEGEDAKTTIITFNNSAKMKGPDGKEIGTFATATLFVDADDFSATNLTIENTAGPVGQALAVSVSGERVQLRNCRLRGWQDTLYVARGRQYLADCYIEGHTDFIFGGGTTVFDRCTIHSLGDGSFITAASTPQERPFGYVFLDCKFTGDGKGFFLGRPWRSFAATAFIRCELGPHLDPRGFENWRNPANEKTARYVEFGCTGPGADRSGRVPWSRELSADEAAKFTVENILQFRDDWSPKRDVTMSSTTQPTSQPSVGSYPWTPDRGDGTYANPILLADYSDPDAIRVGDDYYLTASSFTDTPGLPILHSRDLVNWTIINHAIKNVPDARYEQFQPGCGVWAPAIRFHDGKYWIFFPTPDEGIYVTTATDPAGAWSEPHLLVAGKGLIDPCPFWDDDGKAYLVHAWANSRSGIKHRLTVCEMAPDGSKLIGEGKTVFEDPPRHPTLEGPKFYKRDGWYYILAPAGGVATGWQVALRAKNVFGPYEEKIVLAQGSTPINGPHQGALVDTPAGEWWFLHFQELQPYGRIVHLQPVTWQDGWPIMGDAGVPVLTHAKPKFAASQPVMIPQTSDDFADPKLGLQWQWHANHREDWCSLSARNGWLRLFAQPHPAKGLGAAPNLLLQKLPARSFTVETKLDAMSLADGSESGLIVAGRKSAALSVVREARQVFRLDYRIDDKVAASAKLSAPVVMLRVSMQDGGLCRFSFSDRDDAGFHSFEPTFQAVEGTWIGAKVGLFCVRPADEATTVQSHADFDYFRFGK